MLNTRTWLRIGATLVILLAALFVVIAAWPQAPPDAQSIARRGLTPPEKPASSSSWHPSFGGPRDWFDQGLDALAGWEDNPLGIHRTEFLEHIRKLQESKDPKDQEEYRRLLGLAKIWRDNLLSRYPELKVQYRNIPDERNAFKRLAELAQRLKASGKDPAWSIPYELKDMTSDKKPWNADAAKTWLDANRDRLEEFRAICLMPESSIKDLDSSTFGWWLYEGRIALLVDARLAAERGDFAASLESVRAAMAASDHLLKSEAPCLLEYVYGNGIRAQTTKVVLGSILPMIPAGQTDLAAWENVLNPVVQSPAEFSGIMRGEWNRMMQFTLLPALSDPAETRMPADADRLVETFTKYYSDTVVKNRSLSLADLPTHPTPVLDTSGLSWRSRQIAGPAASFPFRESWERRQIQAGLTQAAFAILKGQPVPNDPIYGRPYSWDPETRQLDLPKAPEFSKIHSRPLTLPKLTR